MGEWRGEGYIKIIFGFSFRNKGHASDMALFNSSYEISK